MTSWELVEQQNTLLLIRSIQRIDRYITAAIDIYELSTSKSPLTHKDKYTLRLAAHEERDIIES